MAGTPTSKIIETIALVAEMEQRISKLTAAFEALTTRVEAMERTISRLPHASGAP